MCPILIKFVLILTLQYCSGSFNEQYRVPRATSDLWEAFVFQGREYVIQDLPVSWEDARILCRGHHNGTLAVLDTREKADFLAEALSELQFSIESVWVGARRRSAEDPEGYRWGEGLELSRTAADVLADEMDDSGHYPLWLNRTRVPVPVGGADCVALERVRHDAPVFLDLPCHLQRPFVCEREALAQTRVQELKSVRCRRGLYRVYDGRLDWHQAAAYCVLRSMALANIASMKCLKKIGLTMLKSRPSIEGAWVGGRGTLGQWTWVDSGLSIFSPSAAADDALEWPPMRDRSAIKQNGCLQIDRHETRDPVFMEARCERKMQFICYQGAPTQPKLTATPSDDNYYYVLVRQLFYWQHAFENCLKLNGSLATIDSNDKLVQLLLVMGENNDQPIEHIWISGRLNMTKEVVSDKVTYYWQSPDTGRIIPDPKSFGEASKGIYMPPWLDEDFTMDSPCLNLDRQDHLKGLVYGLPCDTPQYSICMIEKFSPKPVVDNSTVEVES
ncbi:macrophage mannose receptor 1 [Bicyclus anynana]|uniref:Macrophage mannose receptor 1 n=1 Tax=Bicyclus anynana TaxID=110368 RepID=A0ABM3LV05_BICAN|nr:macrophage mannose receptor 1 [Bicyclus anynana]